LSAWSGLVPSSPSTRVRLERGARALHPGQVREEFPLGGPRPLLSDNLTVERCELSDLKDFETFCKT